MDALAQLQAEATKKIAEAKGVYAKWQGKELDMPQEDINKIDQLMKTVDEIQVKIELASRVGKAASWANDPAEMALAFQTRPAAPDEGKELIDPKAYRTVEYKNWRGEKEEYRFNVPIKVQGKGYPGAYEGYLHKGFGALTTLDQKALSEGTDTAGGFLVSEQILMQLVKKQMTLAVIRQNAKVVPIGKDILTVRRVNYGTASDDTTGNLYTQPGRPVATGEIPSSSTVHLITSAVFGEHKINANTVMASELIYNDMLEDSDFDISAYLADIFGEMYGLYEENQFINGNGINAPMGILAQVDTANGPTSVVSGATTTPYFTYAGVINLEAALPAQYEANSKFLGRKATYSYLRQIVTATTNEPLWPIANQYGYLGVVPANLLGYPLLKSEFMPTAVTSSNYPLLLGDLMAYWIVDRVGLSIQRLDEVYAELNARKFVCRKRFGGQLVEPWKLFVSKIST